MTPPRAEVHLSDPPPPEQLRVAFPSVTYPAGTIFSRSHRHGRGPWWFSSEGEGRFDLGHPHGTCYIAEDDMVALVEAWGGMRVVPSYLAEERDLSAVRVERPRRVADLTSNTARQFGVTAEIFTTTEYARTQLWAAALFRCGYQGVRYWARHDLAHRHACVALFDSGGDNGPTGDRGLPEGSPYGVPQTEHLRERSDLLARLLEETGITVLPVPPAPR